VIIKQHFDTNVLCQTGEAIRFI